MEDRNSRIKDPFRALVSLPDKYYVTALAFIALFFSLHLCLAGAITQEVYNDAPLLFDGGWKVYCGVRPSADFYSSIGPLIYLYIAAGYRLFGLNADSLAYMNALALPSFMALVWFSLRSRMPSFYLFGLTLLCSFCLVASHSLREPCWIATYAMIYNRHGYAWLILFGALLYCPAGTASRSLLRWNSLLAGIILSVLLFLKITYFMAAMPLLAVRLISAEKSVLSYKYIVVGFLGLSFFIMAYLRFDIFSVIDDLTLTAKARSHFFVYKKVFADVFLTKWQLLLAVSMAALTWSSFQSRSIRSAMDSMLVPAVFLGISLMIFENNGPVSWSIYDELPLVPALFILLLVRTQDKGMASDATVIADEAYGKRPLAIFLCVATCCFYILPDMVSILSTVYKPHFREVSAFESQSMKSLLFAKFGEGPSFTEVTNDGLKLLRDNNLTGARITALDFLIPFSFALLSPPPVGAPTFWMHSTDVSQSIYPDPNRVFRGVDVVMVPNLPGDSATTADLLHDYGDYLEHNFSVVAKSTYWTAYKRK